LLRNGVLCKYCVKILCYNIIARRNITLYISIKKQKEKGIENHSHPIKSRSHQMVQLPCDSDGHCMVCKTNPLYTEILPCRTCTAPWHIPCLLIPPTTFLDWDCPDCCTPQQNNHAPPLAENLISAIQAIQSDISLTEVEKAIKCQKLVGGSSKLHSDNNKSNGVHDIFDGTLNCSFCMQLPERPITVSYFYFNY
jgi:E3 ubiquitin-protein ligase UHRF1